MINKMIKLQRYDVGGPSRYWDEIIEDDTGEWVKADEAQAIIQQLQARIKELEAELERAENAADFYSTYHGDEA